MGEGYRLVTWSAGVRPEERSELTRRAPSHGALCAQPAPRRAVIVATLQATGRAVYGLARVAGTEHTQRGGARIWTDFFVGGAVAARREGLHPHDVQSALDGLPPPKKLAESSPLTLVDVARGASTSAPSRDGKSVAMAAVAASLLLDGRVCVLACGPASVTVFEDALHMIPATMRGGLQACAGLRFSPSRAVIVTLADAIDPDTVRATRGQGVECIDLVSKAPPLGGPLAAWFALMTNWWLSGRAGAASELTSRMTGDWSAADVLAVASRAAAMGEQECRGEALDELIRRED